MNTPQARQLPLALSPGTQALLHNFFSLEPNAHALAHMQQLSEALCRHDPRHDITYLWGERGSGKSHLLQGLAQSLKAAGHKVAWFDPQSPLPWTLEQDDSRALVMDDCHAFSPEQQHAAFTLFIEAQTLGLPVIASGSLPPVDLPLREDLRSRLAWGVVFELHPLSESAVRAVLMQEADRRGLSLTEDVLSFILTRQARDLRSLMHLLDRLDEFGLSQHRRITIPLVKDVLNWESA